MKKITLLVSIAAISLCVNAQERGAVTSSSSSHLYPGKLQVKVMPASGNRANGDTLMYMPLPETYVNATDNAGFDMTIEDIDQLPTNNTGFAMDFGMYYSTDSSLDALGHPTSWNYYHPWETPAPAGTDTAYLFEATSWFNPAGQANNWLEFGPLTIPTSGATLSWYERFNRWKDGYKVLVSTVVSSPLTFVDFTDAPIFVSLDTAYSASNPPSWVQRDSSWQLRRVELPASYNGQVVAIAFNHNANDMDVFKLDEILLVEGPLGINENSFVNGVKLLQNSPNPFNHVSTVNYELEKSATISLAVYDVTGKKVIEQTQGNQNPGKHNLKINADNLAAGVYYYSLIVGNNTTSTMKMVVIK